MNDAVAAATAASSCEDRAPPLSLCLSVGSPNASSSSSLHIVSPGAALRKILENQKARQRKGNRSEPARSAESSKLNRRIPGKRKAWLRACALMHPALRACGRRSRAKDSVASSSPCDSQRVPSLLCPPSVDDLLRSARMLMLRTRYWIHGCVRSRKQFAIKELVNNDSVRDDGEGDGQPQTASASGKLRILPGGDLSCRRRRAVSH